MKLIKGAKPVFLVHFFRSYMEKISWIKTMMKIELKQNGREWGQTQTERNNEQPNNLQR